MDRRPEAADPVTAEIYARSGIGARSGFGQRPALLVVDLQRGFTEAGSGVGGGLDAVVAAVAELLPSARETGVPIAYTAVGFQLGEQAALPWLRKMPGLRVLVDGTRWCEIDPRVAPAPGEPIWVKRAPSAFWGTPALAYLLAHRVDTLVVTGCVTSGCVRATAVDAVSAGFRVVVARECVGDRAPGPHAANLLDIDAKYGDVVALDEVIARLRRRATR